MKILYLANSSRFHRMLKKVLCVSFQTSHYLFFVKPLAYRKEPGKQRDVHMELLLGRRKKNICCGPVRKVLTLPHSTAKTSFLRTPLFLKNIFKYAYQKIKNGLKRMFLKKCFKLKKLHRICLHIFPIQNILHLFSQKKCILLRLPSQMRSFLLSCREEGGGGQRLPLLSDSATIIFFGGFPSLKLNAF